MFYGITHTAFNYFLSRMRIKQETRAPFTSAPEVR